MAKVSDAHLEARRQSILDAAMAVFSRKGYQQATMADVATEAGISPGAIYRYFDSKVDLVHQCFHMSAATVADEWSHSTAPARDGFHALGMIAQKSFAEIVEPDAGIFTVMMLEQALDAARPGNDVTRASVNAEQEVLISELQKVIQRAIDDGSLSVELNAYHLAGALMAFYQGARLARLTNPETDVQAQLGEVHKLLTLAHEHAQATEPKR